MFQQSSSKNTAYIAYILDIKVEKIQNLLKKTSLAHWIYHSSYIRKKVDKL